MAEKEKKEVELRKKRTPKELMEVFESYSVRSEPVKHVARIPTGILSLDENLWGGLPEGKITMWFGPTGGGKTTISMLIARQFTQRGLTVMWIDAENSFDFAYAEAMGWDVEDAQAKGLLYYFPYTENKMVAEKWLDTITMMVSSGIPYLIVVDSIAALPTMAEANSSTEKANVATMARVLTPWLKSIAPDLAASHCALLLINQIRDTIGSYGSAAPHFPGGRALEHHTHLVLKSLSPEKPESGDFIIFRYKVFKTKVFQAPSASAEFELQVSVGSVVEVDFITELMVAGIKHGYITNAEGGAYEKNLAFLQDEMGELHKLGNGKKQLLKALEDDTLLDILKARVFKRIGLPNDQRQDEGSN